MNTDKKTYQIGLVEVKKILFYIGIIKANDRLCEKSWFHFYENGYTPIRAVKEDMIEGGIKLPFINWRELNKINISL